MNGIGERACEPIATAALDRLAALAARGGSVDPPAAEHPGLPESRPEHRKKPDRLAEVLDGETDVDEVGDAGAMAVP